MHKFTKRGDFDGRYDDETKTALADERRRFALYDLIAHFHPVPVHDLTDRLLAWERVETDRPSAFEEVAERLREDHLPALQRAGLVETTVDGERYTASRMALDLELTIRGLGTDVPDDE